MKRVLFIYYLLGGLLFLLPDWLNAQGNGNMVGIELTGKQEFGSNVVFDYRRSEIRNQLCIPPEVLCLSVGTQIHAISIPYKINIYDGSTLTQSLGNMRIALGECQSIPSYSYPYSYIEEGMATLYEGGDQLEMTLTNKMQFVTYNLSAPFTYNGGYLLVDLKTTTAVPITQNINISTNFHEYKSILNLRGQDGKQPYKNDMKPDLVLGVITSPGNAVPYIPLQFRESILGYAPVGGSSPKVDIQIANIGDQPLEVKGITGSENFALVNSKMVAVGSEEIIQFQFTPKNAGTREETVFLQTSAGKIEMNLSGTTYRQTPYNRVIKVSPENPLWEQLMNEEDRLQITELSIEGQVTEKDMSFASYEIPNLIRLDMSAAVSSDANVWFNEECWPQFEQLALPAGVKSIRIPQTATNLSKLILPLGFEGLSGDYNQETQKESLPANLTTLIAFGLNSISVNSDAIQTIETVYVPENALDNWKNDYRWHDKNILPITDAVLHPDFGGNMLVRDEWVITMDNYPKGEIGINIKPDEGQVTASASLINKAPVQIKELNMSYKLNGRGTEYNEPLPDGLFVEKGIYSVFINENEEAALQSVSCDLKLQPQKWHFLSFPFDVERTAFVSAPENGSRQYVVRTYDGQSRADNGMHNDRNWKDETMKLKAGCGYILQTDDPEQYQNDDRYYKLSLRIEGADLVRDLMKTEAVSIPLEYYGSSYDDNKSWNLIGNPYLSFYDIRDIVFGSASIIVIWDGQGYIPLSIKDDSYSLRPLEAFFVQKPDGEEVITFKPEGRRINAESTVFYALRSISDTDRKVLNLRLSGETYTDRARIVINPSAQPGYDMNNDAVKWMSSNKEIPQFYTLGGEGKRYAINERPLGTGSVPVGLYVGQTGIYTFEKVEDEIWEQVCLLDKYENKQVDLCCDSYSFHADKGTVDDRFEIRFGIPTSNLPVTSTTSRVRTEGHTLHIEVGEKTEVTIYTASGIEKYRNRIEVGSTAIHLESGFYLVRINETTHKVIIH